MSKSKIIDKNITEKSKKADIEREIERLKIHVSKSSDIDQVSIKKTYTKARERINSQSVWY